MKYCLFLSLLACNVVFAQSFITRVSPKVIGIQDVVQVEYVADGAELSQFNLPKYINWTLVSGPNMSSSTVGVNNTMQQQQTIISVMLMPQITGTIVIPGASALINSKPQTSNPVTVQVKNVKHTGNKPTSSAQVMPILDMPPMPSEVPASQYLHKGENPVEKIKNNILLRLEVSKQSCYVGEPIIATYKLCSRLKAQSKVNKQPAFNGCTVVELTRNYPEQHVEKINGQDYNVFEIRKVQLTPLNAGTLELPAMEVENEVSFYTRPTSRDVFGNTVGEQEQRRVTITNKPLTITAINLPPYTGGAIPFSGAIGNFSLAFRAGEAEFTTTGSNHLFLIVQGVGNLQGVKLPVINWPNGIETFEATVKDELDRENNPVITQKVFTIPFVADAKGTYILPAVPFNYFDPSSGKYVTKTTNSFLFKVKQGTKAGTQKTGESTSFEDFDQRLYVILGAALLAIIIGLAWYSGTRRSKLPPELKPSVTADQQAPAAPVFSGADYLYGIQKLEPLEDTRPFYKDLSSILKAYLLAKFGVQPSETMLLADQHPHQSAIFLQLKKLIEDCTLGVYTPFFNREAAMDHRLQAIILVEQLENK